MKNKILHSLLIGLFLCAPLVQAEQLLSQKFKDMPLDMLVEFYNEWTGRTLIIQADLSQRITLKYSKLTKEEAMQAIETVLAMNGIALVPMGEKFLKVVPISTARQEGLAIQPYDPDKEYATADQLITQVIPLRYIVFADVQPVVQQLIHGYGNVLNMERINSVLITDTSANIARIVEVITMLDQPLEKIEPRIYQLNFAKADTISSKLNELIEAARPKSGQKTASVGNVRTIPGVIRAARTAPGISSSNNSYNDETQMIQGDVKLVSDERTNILIVFSKAANFDFFDRIIKVLDVPVDPDVITEVVNLEYAEAKDISGILNEFVGAASSDEETKTVTTGGANGSRSVDEVIRERTAPKREISAAAKSAIGRLSADTKILSDERTNSLLLMGSRGDIEALKEVIANLDVMLEQVLIEVMILNVGLADKLETGVQWVYDSAMTKTEHTMAGLKPFAGLTNSVLPQAFGYYGVFPELDLELLVSAIDEDSGSSILSTPIVLTTDNTEAKITIAKERPVITSSINSGAGTDNNYSARATYEYRTIGIELTVTPHINPDRFVLMEISQSADQVGNEVTIDQNSVPEILKREISATVAVQDRSTIVLGGLVGKSESSAKNGIPLLKDIPFIGRLFSYQTDKEDREELVILLTPYVLTNPEEASRETKRRLQSSDVSDIKWPRNWSESPLKNDEPESDAWKNKHQKKTEKQAEEDEKDRLLQEVKDKEAARLLQEKEAAEQDRAAQELEESKQIAPISPYDI